MNVVWCNFHLSIFISAIVWYWCFCLRWLIGVLVVWANVAKFGMLTRALNFRLFFVAPSPIALIFHSPHLSIVTLSLLKTFQTHVQAARPNGEFLALRQSIGLIVRWDQRRFLHHQRLDIALKHRGSGYGGFFRGISAVVGGAGRFLVVSGWFFFVEHLFFWNFVFFWCERKSILFFSISNFKNPVPFLSISNSTGTCCLF